MAACNEFSSMTFLKWFKHPDDPSLNWSFTEDGTATVKDVFGSTDGFTMPASSGCDTGLQSTGIKENIASSIALKISPLDSYLRDISENEAKFPNTTESKLIFETLDKVVLKMSTALGKKAKLFNDCSTVRVGSSAEGLKSGNPNEFDYNIILPKLSEYVGLEHSLHNNSLSESLNSTFFSDDTGDYGKAEEDSIYFTIENFDDVIDDVIPKSEMRNMLKEEIDDIGELMMHGSSMDGNVEGWKETLAQFVSMPQRSILKVLFKALEKIIEETLQESLVPELSILPKKSLRECRSLNQIAITSSLLWHGTEFQNLEINVDFALMIPMEKQPLCYDFPMYLHGSQESMLPIMIPLQDADKIFHYIIRSYKTCRLSTGIAEAEMLSKIPSNSKVKQSIRVCKKLRDLFMTHYFDIATETVCPILQSYWIKTVAMYIFRLHHPCSESEETDGGNIMLSRYIIEIFTVLQKCLTGDEGKRKPFLSSFNVPFKNLLHSAPKLDEEVEASYLDDEEKEIMCRQNVIAANDIRHLLEVFQRFHLNYEEAMHDITNMKRDNEEAKSLIYKEGMREKLGILLFQHFEMEDSHPLSTDEKPYFMEFIECNFPDMQIMQLKENESEEIEYCSIITMVNIRLVEHYETLDLAEMFTKAYNRINFFGLDIAKNITADHHRSDFN
eukprot:Seg8346.1 transcript_id=Seg8346.1/GoldUCD/mRNA.D3Y31 product="hypothetical protein" protein_id=Seg8346.1/GoldUCD/D3Y31